MTKLIMSVLLSLILSLGIAQADGTTWEGMDEESPPKADISTLQPVLSQAKVETKSRGARCFNQPKMKPVVHQTPVHTSWKTNPTLSEFGSLITKRRKDAKGTEWVVPGLEEGYVPQGIADLPEKQLIIVSMYHDEKPAILVLIDKNTGKMVKSLYMLWGHTGGLSKSHASGLAATEKYLFMATDQARLIRFRLDDVLSCEGTAVKIDGMLPVDSFASSVSSHFDKKSNTWWLILGEYTKKKAKVGPFSVGKKIAPPKHHTNGPWAVLYKVNDVTGEFFTKMKYIVTIRKDTAAQSVFVPDAVISDMPQKTQGVGLSNTHFAQQSTSGEDPSSLRICASPFLIWKKSKVMPLPQGNKTLHWSFDLLGCDTIKTPAGGEDLEIKGNYLFTYFEGLALKYRSERGKYSHDGIVEINLLHLKQKANGS